MKVYVNDGSDAAPAFKAYFNLGTLTDLPESCGVPKGSEEDQLSFILDAGYEGVQGGDPEICARLGLPRAGAGRINRPEEALPHARHEKSVGAVCSTVHVGWGMESDAEIDDLFSAIVEASKETELPIYVKTHRATVTQDTWRTVQAAARHPELFFNGDFSHWYIGLEMVYGDWREKVDFILPVLEKVGFYHGRIGNPGHIQVPFDGSESFVAHFEELWTLSMKGFLDKAGPGDQLPFAPELLHPSIFYAHEHGGAEVGNRWELSLKMTEIAKGCWARAQGLLQN